MKVAISLYLLVCLCEIRSTYAGGDGNFGSGLDPFRIYVRDTRRDIKDKTARLKGERIATYRQMLEMIDVVSNSNWHILQRNLTDEITQLQEFFAVVAANGTDVEYCIKRAVHGFHEIREAAKLHLKDCINGIKNYFTKQEEFTWKIEEDALELYKELNNIFSKCQDFPKHYKCIYEEVSSCTPRVRKLNKRFDQHFYFYKQVLDVAYMFSQSCIRKCRDNAENVMLGIIGAAHKCVENA